MVKAKKTKNIHLTLVKKKGVQLKKDVIEKIRSYIDKYDNIYLFSFNKNTNTNLIKEMREYWKGDKNGRFTFAKNKVTAVALGKKPEDEYHNNCHLLAKDLKGDSCLLYTSCDRNEVEDYIKISKKNGIDLELKSYWNKAGDYNNFKKLVVEKMDV